MSRLPIHRYRPAETVDLPDRQWPNRRITQAPYWCSVDLRDGNQALITPMGYERKRRMFDLLLNLGFKEIEVGFPAASQTDYDFTRALIEEGAIPDDVAIQVLCQARTDLIDKTFEAVKGAPKVVFHVYNSTSPMQREVVFGGTKDDIVRLATQGVQRIKDNAAKQPETQFTLQYSPESFSQTELDFAKHICEQVMAVWQPTPDQRMILNLPATVEIATPNVHADQIEWFCRNVKNRDSVIISLHPHNDRGTGIAATELALMAGGERVEGTLFGNGERTGNVDIINLGLNMMTQGVDPQLDLSDVAGIREVVEYCNQMDVPPRHPYGGDLVFTAFSGSHQDAIKKGMAHQRQRNDDIWEVPYLPIDPQDIGREFEGVVRINSQSGKGGIAYVLEEEYNLTLPRKLQMEFARVIQQIADKTGSEIKPEEIWETFQDTYLSGDGRLGFVQHRTYPDEREAGARVCTALLTDNGVETEIEGHGNGPIDAFVDALKRYLGIAFEVLDYHEHATGSGADATAVAYVQVQPQGQNPLYGVGMDPNIVTASLRAIVSAMNRALAVDRGHIAQQGGSQKESAA